ncbi:MAG: SDR family oxidoreductase [Planctomycetaceae bacterium]|nr:SDR family oxidoreductase [Planctomycetaceae bacterium]
MKLELQNQTAVVVGGATGLGAAIAKGFANEGGRVAIIDLHPDTESLANNLTEGSPPYSQTLGILADATNFEAVKQARDAVVAQFGKCDHLIYAAGTGSGHYGFPFWNVPPDVWPRVLAVNLTGAVHAAQAFVPHLIQSQGTLCFLSSVAGQMGSQTDPPYSAAKAGLINFAQCAAKDLAPHGVRVNTICPGMIPTTLNQSVYEAWASQQPEDSRMTYEIWGEEKIQRVVPLRRWQTPEDIAAMALFLASPRAANITGQTLNVDGGFVMHW